MPEGREKTIVPVFELNYVWFYLSNTYDPITLSCENFNEKIGDANEKRIEGNVSRNKQTCEIIMINKKIDKTLYKIEKSN